MLRHVDLCSGIGGFALGFEWADLSKPVLFCDIEQWSRKVLAKHWPDVPIAYDVKELANDPARLVPDCDILTAGYPCQPFSVAGKQRGAEDDRHIWPQIFTIVQAKRPDWCVFENVSGHISLGLDTVLSDLESKGYSCQAFVIPACAVNAPHRRDRVWIIARNVGNSEHDGSSAATVSGKHGQDDARGAERQSAAKQSEGASKPRHDADVGNAGCVTKRQPRNGFSEKQFNSSSQRKRSVKRHRLADTGENKHQSWWAVEPAMGRVAHGIPRRVDRLKGLGNAIVPQIAMQIGLTIKAVHNG